MLKGDVYGSALERLILKLETMTHELDSGLQDSLSEICVLLKVAKLQANFFDDPRLEKIGSGELKTLYSSEEQEDSTVEELSITNKNNSIIHYYVYHKDGEEPWDEEDSRHIHVLLKLLYTFQARVRTLRMIEEISFRDRELGIYNLPYFLKTVGMVIGRGMAKEFGVCYFNLRNFTSVNDKYGRDTGTAIMKDYIKFLDKSVGDRGIVCRIGGDNFITLFPKEKYEIVKILLAGSYRPVAAIPGEFVYIHASAGYYLISEDVKSPEEVMDRVAMAFQCARRSVETNFTAYYNVGLQKQQERVRQIEALFKKAMEEEEFQVYYQPKVELEQYQLSGAEALCRWIHEGELIPPDSFIPILEKSQAICDLDFYMLDHVCRDIKQWISEGKEPVKVSVNLSRRHMNDPYLLKHILDIIDGRGIPHKYIEIELTETTTDVDFRILKGIVSGLKENDIFISIDDFGTGFSSLNLLREAPWDVLKIDKSFLPDENHVKDNRTAMLKHIIGMSNDLGLSCIVEGVETKEQVEILKKYKCYQAQGFYFDRPMTKEEFEKRLSPGWKYQVED